VLTPSGLAIRAVAVLKSCTPAFAFLTSRFVTLVTLTPIWSVRARV
jgi:hypothetical protein